MKFLQNMDPLTMILLTLGFINTANNMTKDNTLPVSGLGNRYQDYLVTDFLPPFIKKFESGAKTRYNAYLLKGENKYTIGNGNTIIYGNDYKFIRYVKASDTLDTIKVVTKNTNLSNEEMAFKLTKNHLNGATRTLYLQIAKDLDNRGVLFEERVSQCLYEALYGSGQGIIQKSSSTYKIFIQNMQFSSNTLQRISAILGFRLRYYKSLPSAWKIYYDGWTTRILTVSKYFSGLISYSEIENQLSIYGRNYNQKRIDLKTIFGISELI